MHSSELVAKSSENSRVIQTWQVKTPVTITYSENMVSAPYLEYNALTMPGRRLRRSKGAWKCDRPTTQYPHSMWWHWTLSPFSILWSAYSAVYIETMEMIFISNLTKPTALLLTVMWSVASSITAQLWSPPGAACLFLHPLSKFPPLSNFRWSREHLHLVFSLTHCSPPFY